MQVENNVAIAPATERTNAKHRCKHGKMCSGHQVSDESSSSTSEKTNKVMSEKREDIAKNACVCDCCCLHCTCVLV